MNRKKRKNATLNQNKLNLVKIKFLDGKTIFSVLLKLFKLEQTRKNKNSGKIFSHLKIPITMT